MRFSVIQKWRPNRDEHAEFLDFNIDLTGLLDPPVTGLLAPSYQQAIRTLGAADKAIPGLLLTAKGATSELD